MNEDEKVQNDEIEQPLKSIDLPLEANTELATSHEEVEKAKEEKTEDISETDNYKNKIEEISSFIASIKNDLEIRNERDKYKDEAIQRMSKQVVDFEKGIFEKIKKELINEIISFYDMLLKFQDKFKYIENKELQNEIDFLETEVSNILFNNSIDEIEENIGSGLNRDLQKIKNKVETTKQDENLKVRKILKKGFIWNNKVLRKQEVEILEFKEATNE